MAANQNQQGAAQTASANNASEKAQPKISADNVKDVSKKIAAGESYAEHPGMTPAPSQDQMASAVGSLELAGALGDTAAFKARQHLLNPKDYKKQFKSLNPGKPPNNQDAFPVDLKIEEFEVHTPSCKVYELTTPIEGKEAAMAAMAIGDHAEKRIIKLENNMATLMRYLFRLGARVNINCVYYGGQTPFQKYKCIRCMCDDRISDGQLVQIDQCLTCTRYEPVYGQCYEIMNDLAANVATILDDNQFAYANMEDYIELNRIERMHTEKKTAKFDLLTVKTQDPMEQTESYDLETRWGQGLKMDWKYVPKEIQKCHINWRQSINDDGSRMQRLASFPQNEANDGANITKGNGAGTGSEMQKNLEALDSFKADAAKQGGGNGSGGAGNDEAEKYYQVVEAMKNEASSFATGNKDDILNRLQGESFNDLKKKAKEAGMDAVTLACAQYITNENPLDIIERYKKMASTIDSQNGAIVWSAYSTNEKVILGEPDSIYEEFRNSEKTNNASDTDKNGNLTNRCIVKIGKVPRIDHPMCKAKSSTSGGDGSGSGSSGGTGGYGCEPINDGVHIDWDQRADWLWVNFAPRYIRHAGALGFAQESCTLYPKMLYLYRIVAAELVESRFDTDEYNFPFTDEQMMATDIWYTSPFGWRASTNSMHRGIDIACDRGVEIHAVHNGTVTSAGNGFAGDWNSVNIDHGDGTYSRYLHCASILVSQGQKVAKGDVIATVGGTGPDGPDQYPNHLHLEISQGGAEEKYSDTDPLTYFPKFDIPKDGQIKPA